MIVFGIVSYKDRSHLESCLPAVLSAVKKLEAKGRAAQIVLQDNAQDEALRAWLGARFSGVLYQTDVGGNLGYGAGYNAILKAHPEADFLVAVTSDVVLIPEAVERIFEAFDQDEELVMAAGKLALGAGKAATENQALRLDSAGIWAQKRHHFSEWGSGALDAPWVDEGLGEIFGISGAAFVLRTAVVPLLLGSSWELFDSRFWMYKEDIDLAYRLRWLGLKIQVFPWVWGTHVRGAANREGVGVKGLVRADTQKPKWIRRHSYQNHLRLLKNQWSWGLGLGIFLRVFFYEFCKAGYLLFRDPWGLCLGLWGLLFEPARRSARRARVADLKKFFH